MSVTITISNETYQSLESLARLRGKKSVEQLLEDFESLERGKELEERRKIGKNIRDFQKRMSEKYGIMPDSTDLINEDRAR